MIGVSTPINLGLSAKNTPFRTDTVFFGLNYLGLVCASLIASKMCFCAYCGHRNVSYFFDQTGIIFFSVPCPQVGEPFISDVIIQAIIVFRTQQRVARNRIPLPKSPRASSPSVRQVYMTQMGGAVRAGGEGGGRSGKGTSMFPPSPTCTEWTNFLPNATVVRHRQGHLRREEGCGS